MSVKAADSASPPGPAGADARAASASPEAPRTTTAEASEPGADALERALDQLGAFGLYQCYMVVMLCIPGIFSAMYSLNYIFVADSVPFRCLVPECEGGLASAHFWNASAQALQPADAQCARYVPLLPAARDHSCLREDFHLNETKTCEKLVYENHDTIFAEFDLGCREWLRTLVGTVRAAALPFALLLTGFISDTYGRRPAFCIFSGCAGVLGVVKAFSINYQMYVAMEFFEAMLGYGFNSAAYVMMVELGRPSLRAAFACATGVAYGFGGMLFALVAWGVPYWRQLLWTIHAPALLLPMYWLLVDESPRWLHVRRRPEETAAVIKKAARVNKILLDKEIMKALVNDIPQEEKQSKHNPWLALLKSRRLMLRFAACCWCWIAVAFVYYGLTINSVSLAGDKYVNFALNMAMEVVASLLIMMALERFGRKWSIFTAFVICGAACVVPFFISNTRAGFALFFVGKLAITFAFNSVYIFTAELFPTETRSSALALCSLVGRLGNILAPQTPLLSAYVQAILYGGCSLSASLAVLLVPETRRARLPPCARAAESLAPPARSPAPPPPPPPPPRPKRVLSVDV